MKKNFTILSILLLFNLFAIADSSSSSWGVEINPLRTFFFRAEDINSFSGGVNYFDDENGVEIAFPITYNKIKNGDNKYYYYNDYDNTSITTDIHYRKFLKNRASGLYIGGFGRYTYLEGKLKNSIKIAKLHKFGLGAEIGVRFREKNSPIYMGISFLSGVYLGDNNNIFRHGGYIFNMDDRKYFWDVEMLKVGYEF